MTTRRSLILQAMAGAVLAATGPALAQARTVGAIRVDTSRLAAQGWGPRSQEIKRDLERQLATTLDPMIRRGGPTLAVLSRASGWRAGPAAVASLAPAAPAWTISMPTTF
jgi:alpha-beta hydrolase superfamily lysophospholipase